MDKEIRGKLSPAGALGLSALLDQRRLAYGIPDSMFSNQAVFDRVLVWQMPSHDGETFIPGGAVIMPETVKARKKRECPRGIIVSAGLSALDVLRSHGMDLGHVVSIIAVQPWILYLDNLDGKDVGLLMLRDGDIVGSEDLAKNLRAGLCSIAVKFGETGKPAHFFKDESGAVYSPVTPTIWDDQ